jgi:hypothetical protein
MLLDCKQVAEQVSENIDQPLSGMRWLKFKWHLLLCTYCRRYDKQLAISSNMVGSLGEELQPSKELRENVTQSYQEIHCEHKHNN